MTSPVRYIIAATALVVGVVIAVSEPIKAQSKGSERTAKQHKIQEATVKALDKTEVREVPSGKASIRLLAEGEEAFIGLLRMDAGGKVPEHQDTSEEYIHILKGRGTIFIEDKPHTIGPGTTIFMPKNAKVRYENGPEELMAIQVFAGPESATKYQAWKVRQ